MKKNILLGAGILVLAVGVVWVFGRNLKLERELNHLSRVKEAELNQRVKLEQEKIRKQLDQEYHTDQISYEAVAKRLEIEKQRVKELRVPRTLEKSTPLLDE
jgi:signal transduction histidine kinase